MKKNINCVLIIFFIIVLFSSCGFKENEYPWEVKKSTVKIYKNHDISLLIDEDSLSPNKAEFCLNSEVPLRYNNQFLIEVKIGNKWYRINEEFDWFGIEYVLKGKESVTLEIAWEKYYGELPSGNYRLIKPVICQDGEHYLSCEFTI